MPLVPLLGVVAGVTGTLATTLDDATLNASGTVGSPPATSGPNFAGTANVLTDGGAGSWTTPNNATGGDDAAYAVWNKPAAANATSQGLELQGFGTFTGVSSGDTINSVTVDINEFQGNATRMDPFQFELWDGTTAQIGTTQTGNDATITTNVDQAVFTGVTFSQLANLRVRIYAKGSTSNAQTSTGSVDYASLTVSYTAGGVTGTLATNLAGATLDASGTAGSGGVTGTLAATLADATLAAAGATYTLFVEDFEVSPDGTGLTNLNTGFSTYAHTGTAVSDSDVTAASGTYLCRSDVATGQTTIFRLNYASRSVNGFSWFGRYTAFPPAIATLAQIRNDVPTIEAQVRLNTDGTITLRNGTTSTVTSTLAFPNDGTLWRLDWKLDLGAGLQHYAMYTGSNVYGTTPDETASGTYNTAASTHIHWGTITSVGGNWTYWADYFQAINIAAFPLPPAAPAGGPVSGTLATTLAGATLAASGTETFTGTLAATLDGATLAASGSVTSGTTGTLATTLAGATLAATGVETFTGSLATTLSGASLAAAGTETITGTLASTLAGASLAVVAKETIAGTLATTLAGATLAATGVFGDVVSGTLATTLTGATLAAAGTETIPGTLATTLGGAALAATGLVANAVSGTLATQLAGATLAAAGIETIPGALAAALEGVTLAAFGEVGNPVTGTLSAVLDGAVLAAIGTALNPYEPAYLSVDGSTSSGGLDNTTLALAVGVGGTTTAGDTT